MSWVRVDDQFPDHPKLLRLGRQRLAAMGLWVIGLCYSARFLTDGFIPFAALPYGSKKTAQLLVEVCLWDAIEGGYQIHDYGDYQLSRQDVLEIRAKNAERQSRRRSSVTTSVTNGEPREESHDQHPIPKPVPSTEVLSNVPEWIEPTAFFEERTGRKPSQKVRDWLEDLHARFSRKELIYAMTVVAEPKATDWLKKVDAYLETA